MPKRTEYGHFCMVAEALERVGDRWSLLIVRDLLLGPRRFTDLADRLGAITPKTLTVRLRELEENGIITVDRKEGRREVWYSLTPVGRDLQPVLDSLLAWGVRSFGRRPAPGEPVHPEHVTLAFVRELSRSVRPKKRVTWWLHLSDGDDYSIGFDGDEWRLSPGRPDDPDVTIRATCDQWTRFLFLPPAKRESAVDFEVGGAATERRRLRDALAGFPRL